MDRWWPSERRIRRYERLGDYSIEPYGQKFYRLYKGSELVAVFVYKRGALEVMRRLQRLETTRSWQGQVYNVSILSPCLVVLIELGEKGEC